MGVSRGRRGLGVSSGASRGRDRRGGGAAFSRARGAVFGSREAPTPRRAPGGASRRREGGAMTEARPRVAAVDRATNETRVSVRIDLDGGGSAQVETGIQFLDHMLGALRPPRRVRARGAAAGDLDVGGGIAPSRTSASPSDRRCARRWGRSATSVAMGSSCCPWTRRWCRSPSTSLAGPTSRTTSSSRGYVSATSTPSPSHFFQSLVNEAALTLHIRLISGSDTHHIVSAVFKGVARALGVACERHGHDDDLP